MAHELEILDGVASFASFREPAWHTLGTVFTEEKTTAEMLQAARLDNWNVRLEDVQIPDTFDSDKNYFFVTRTNPVSQANDILGVVGERYKILQNEQLFDFGDAILNHGGRWETAGSIKGGRQVFGSLAYERETVLDPTGVADVVKTYILVTTSHDGSLAIQAMVTPVRVVCANTLNLALGSKRGKNSVKQSFKVRHTETAEGKVQAARNTLELTNAYLDAFGVMANKMIQTEITKTQFDEIILAAYPRPEKDAKGAVKKWETKVDMIEEIYQSATTRMIAGTAWGALNAMTERLDWKRVGRNGNDESVMAAASGFDAAMNVEKNRINEIVHSLVMA
jgi:phage/plasmid-like protein (TIGR03299 family)